MINPTRFKHVVTIEDEKLASRCSLGRIIIIDDDDDILFSLSALLQTEGYCTETYQSATDYLDALNRDEMVFDGPICILCDVNMPVVNGLEFQRRMAELRDTPIIFMSGGSGINAAVQGFRAGAVDFLIKPFEPDALLFVVSNSLQLSSARQKANARKSLVLTIMETLTPREMEIAREICKGKTNGALADEFGINIRTVKLHRHRTMEKLCIEKVSDLVRIVDEYELLINNSADSKT